MVGKKLMGKGLARVEKHGIMKAGIAGSKKQVPGKVGGSVPTKTGKNTATSTQKQPEKFAGNATVRAAGFTRFVN